MRSSIRARFVGAFVATAAALGMFAGVAGAADHGFSGGASTNSIVNSGGLGTCRAASTPAGNQANSATIFFYPGYFYCGQE